MSLILRPQLLLITSYIYYLSLTHLSAHETGSIFPQADNWNWTPNNFSTPPMPNRIPNSNPTNNRPTLLLQTFTLNPELSICHLLLYQTTGIKTLFIPLQGIMLLEVCAVPECSLVCGVKFGGAVQNLWANWVLSIFRLQDALKQHSIGYD